MSVRPVDLRGALIADYPRGRLLSQHQQPLLALPASALEALLASSSETAHAALVHSLAPALEAAAREALDGPVRDCGPEDIAYAINAAFARYGLGHVLFERHGDLLAARLCDAPGAQPSSAVTTLVGKLVAALITALTATPVHAQVLAGEPEPCVVLADPTVCALARTPSAHTLATLAAAVHLPSQVAS
ncbi:MAG: hypothetical protein Q8Q09_10235 [Deltaproteobacteria bacterium]|nr:hypothetical protein [Deltaproteobacteria bacterium]